MIVLQESNLAQEVKFIPTRVSDLSYDSQYLLNRVVSELATLEAVQCLNEYIGYLPNLLKLRNETTNVVTTQTISTSVESYYFKFSTILNLEQGHFYTMELFANGNLIHRDKIFCTNQNIDTYSVNSGQYVPKGNDIIFYE